MLDGEIARITSIVLPQDLDPKTRVDTNINLTSLERLSEAYGDLLAGFGGADQQSVIEAIKAARDSGDFDRAIRIIEANNANDTKALEELLSGEDTTGR